jgi:hypothetical protein
VASSVSFLAAGMIDADRRSLGRRPKATVRREACARTTDFSLNNLAKPVKDRPNRWKQRPVKSLIQRESVLGVFATFQPTSIFVKKAPKPNLKSEKICQAK